MGVSVTVNSFGPVHRGTIHVSPLTIFVGPNNAGKSMMAMLVYAVMRSIPRYGYLGPGGRILVTRRPRRSQPYRFFRARSTADDDLYAEATRQLDLFLSQELPEATEVDADALPSQVRAFLSERLQEQLSGYGAALGEEIERSLGAQLHELATIDNDGRGLASLKVVVESDAPRWSLTLEMKGPNLNVEVSAPALDDVLNWDHVRDSAPDVADAELLMTIILEGMFADVFNAFPNTAYYLPAARSGFLQSHRALAASVMRSAPFAGIEDMKIPRMSGVIGDFIARLLELEPEPQRRRSRRRVSTADSLEEDLLRGTIELERSREAYYPDLGYRSRGHLFPLHRTSSTVSEMAPLVLFLRHVVEAQDLLIIEEPESHLHPVSQRILADALAVLAEDIHGVILTTHSEVFMGQLNNSIRRRALRRSSGEEGMAGLRNMRGYLFRPDNIGLSTIEELPVDGETGLNYDEFGETMAALYNESADIEDKLLETRENS